MGREADDGRGSEDAARQRGRRVVLADVDAVGLDLEGEIGSVVQDEWHAQVGRDDPDQPGAGDQIPSRKLLVAELDDVDTAADAGNEEIGEIRAVRRAQVQPPITEIVHALAAAAFAAAFTAFLAVRTSSSVSLLTMSATERSVPGSP